MVGSVDDVDDCRRIGEVATPVRSAKTWEAVSGRTDALKRCIPNTRLAAEIPDLELDVLVLYSERRMSPLRKLWHSATETHLNSFYIKADG